MPKISKRGEALSESPIRFLAPLARNAVKTGKKILHLNIGQPDILTPTNAVNQVKDQVSEIIAYGPSEGKMSLRKTVADYYQKFDVNIEPEDVIVTTGASEAILFTLFSCFDSGDEIIIPEPFYANYLGFSHMGGIRIRPITTTLEEGFKLPSIDTFERIIVSNTRAIFLCNPGNPTGQLYDAESLKQLAKLVKKHDLFLVVDEVYREFCYEEAFMSVLTLSEIEEHVIVLDSISKVFSSCGARVGYIVTKNKDLQGSIKKFAQLRLCPPMIGQILAEACYSDTADYLTKVKEKYNQRRLKLYERLSAIEGVKCYMPNAAFYNMVELPIDDAQEFCKWLLTDFDYKGYTIMLAPASGFYFNPALGRKQVRIAFVLDVEKLDLAMDCLEAGLKEYTELKAV